LVALLRHAAGLAHSRLVSDPRRSRGRRRSRLLGGIFAYDIPEYAMSMKIKAVTTAWAAIAVLSQTPVFGFIKKLN
jgi:hypothetical protein